MSFHRKMHLKKHEKQLIRNDDTLNLQKKEHFIIQLSLT